MKQFILPALIMLSSFVFSQRNTCAISKRNSNLHKSVVPSEIQDLENKYDVKFYHLDVDVEITNKFISGNVRTLASVLTNSLDTFAFELHANHTIDSIKINGQTISYSRVGAAVYALLPQTLNANQMIDAVVYYNGTAPSSGSAAIGDGFNNKSSPSWGNKVTWSLSESYVAYEWWPCKQQLRDKADSSYCYITTDSTNKAGSNGLLTNVVLLGNGKNRYEWKSRHAIDYYLISVAVAQYIDYSFYAHPIGSDSVLVQNYIYNNPATLPNFKAIIDQTDDLIEFFSTKFGLYYFNDEKYGHCMAPLSGGMEHQTMTTLGFFDFTLVAHELGHQWFGDNVTCKTWSDIFVNEGFAAYSEYLALEAFDNTQTTQHMLDVHNSVMSQAGGSIWFTNTSNTNRIFDSRLSYDKGSALLHMLRYEINNDSIFFLGLKTFQQQYSKSVATSLEFKAVMEIVSGLNLQVFFDQWFYGQGYPIFTLKYNQIGNSLIIKNTETVSLSSATPFFKTHLDYLIHTTSGDTTIRLEQNQNAEFYTLEIFGNVTGIEIDSKNWVVNKVNSIGIDTALSIVEKDSFDKYLVYPNPTKDILHFQRPLNTNARIYNSNGELICTEQISNIVDVKNLNAGFYFLEFKTYKGENQRIKFIKQ